MADHVNSQEGYIYFIYAKELKRVKIGFSINLNKRMANITTVSPVELKIIKVIKGTMLMEKFLLVLFSEYQVKGEWFRATPTLMKFIRSLKHKQKIRFTQLLRK